ncbi:envelope glycoprotein N [Equid alphaherpesvirus 3]|uniref:Envelope glycoprotein N n=1 Tax=Equid alphaherpesvirus 3 TaxID=80341 RepID=A0A077B997_9ALPH|nr:envelope glycoprotein N [Equid alphaherpesvirus 3]AIL02927.1 envelope glycoprotein N [Equid alphaherpesvirus 3]
MTASRGFALPSILGLLLLVLAATARASYYGDGPRDRLDAARDEDRQRFWSAACSGRGFRITAPGTAAILFYVALVAVGVAVACQAYRAFLRIVTAEMLRRVH